MDGFSTLTQKGQVAIPKAIRDHFGLKTSDKIHFSVEDNKIVVKPVRSLNDMYGMVKTKKARTKKEMKKTIREAVIKKYENRSRYK